MRHVPVTGSVFGDYIVVDETLELSKDSKRMFHVRCKCGKEEYKMAKNLKSGRCVSCKSCASKKTAITYPPPVIFKGLGGLSKTHYNSIRNGAKVRDIEFDISLSFLWNLFLEQDCKCAISGLPIILEARIKNTNPDWSIITASVDRINSDEPYIESNVWWVHKRLNKLKNSFSMEELLYWSTLIVLKHGNPDPSVLNRDVVGTKEQRLDGEDLNQ